MGAFFGRVLVSALIVQVCIALEAVIVLVFIQLEVAFFADVFVVSPCCLGIFTSYCLGSVVTLCLGSVFLLLRLAPLVFLVTEVLHAYLCVFVIVSFSACSYSPPFNVPQLRFCLWASHVVSIDAVIVLVCFYDIPHPVVCFACRPRVCFLFDDGPFHPSVLFSFNPQDGSYVQLAFVFCVLHPGSGCGILNLACTLRPFPCTSE